MSRICRDIGYYVDRETGCHICTSHKPDTGGYPRIQREGKQRSVHCYVYEQTYGPIPQGLLVCHKCDTPKCVNPKHLFLGTQLDNIRDMDKKGRRRNKNQKGKNNGNAKLTDKDILEIRASQLTQVELAQIYNVHQAHISRIKLRKNWGEI